MGHSGRRSDLYTTLDYFNVWRSMYNIILLPSESSMVQTALASHQGWVVAVQWAPNREHQLLSGSYDSSLKSVISKQVYT